MKRSAQRIVAATKAATAGEAEEAGARNCGKPGFCVSKNASMSTGMSIKELFDYAVKSRGGKLPKASFTPPAVGYISSTAPARDTTGEKRIYFEGRISALFEELMNKPLPQKEVSLEALEEDLEKSLSKKNKKTVRLGFNNAGEKDKGTAEYDTGDGEAINPLILAVLRRLYASEPESRKKLLSLAKKKRGPRRLYQCSLKRVQS